MKLHFVVAQRHERYVGEHAPEVLDVFDENTVASNAEFVRDSLREHEEGDDFENVVIIDVLVEDSVVMVLDGKIPAPANKPYGERSGDVLELHVLLGRTKAEPDDVAALGAMDGIGIEDGNTQYLIDMRERLQREGELLSAAIVVLSVPMKPVMALLRPKSPVLTAEVVHVER